MVQAGLKAAITPPPQIAAMSKHFTTPLAKQLGIFFNQLSLLDEAMTHRSYVNEYGDHVKGLKDNERLEFLGDAVVELVGAEWVFSHFPDISEGELSLRRSELTRTDTQAEFARACHLEQFIRMGKGEEANGGTRRNTVLCGAFEALIGAIYLDKGMDAARDFLHGFIEPAMEEIASRVSSLDDKSRFQEWSQAQEAGITPTYHTLGAWGPDHRKNFLVELRMGDVPVGWGNARSKRRAEQAAARMALIDFGVDDEG
jgi:ribonuclease III